MAAEFIEVGFNGCVIETDEFVISIEQHFENARYIIGIKHRYRRSSVLTERTLDDHHSIQGIRGHTMADHVTNYNDERIVPTFKDDLEIVKCYEKTRKRDQVDRQNVLPTWALLDTSMES